MLQLALMIFFGIALVAAVLWFLTMPRNRVREYVARHTDTYTQFTLVVCCTIMGIMIYVALFVLVVPADVLS